MKASGLESTECTLEVNLFYNLYVRTAKFVKAIKLFTMHKVQDIKSQSIVFHYDVTMLLQNMICNTIS